MKIVLSFVSLRLCDLSESYERARDHVLYFGFSSLCHGVFVVRISGSVLGDFATLRENHLFFSFCRAFFVPLW